jgi:hypothetical protein
MPKLRLNLRDLDVIDDMDLQDEVDAIGEREAREARDLQERDRRPISPVALERRQAQRKFGKDIARMMRERKSPKP